MKLALILGVQGEKVKPKLVNVKDNLAIDCYLGVRQFLDGSLKRELVYDRVITLATLVDKTSVVDLRKFWKKFCPETEMVFLCRKDVDEELAKHILKEFTSVKVATMLVKSTTLQIFSEAVLLAPEQITKNYGISDYLSIDTDFDDGVEFAVPETESPVEEAPIEQKPVQQPKNVPKKKEKKKGGFFSGLFGGKKKQQKEVPSTEQEQFTENDNSEEVEEQETEGVTFGAEVEEKETLSSESMEEQSEQQIPNNSETIEEEQVIADVDNEKSSEVSMEEPIVTREDTRVSFGEKNEKSDVNTAEPSTTHQQIFKEEENEFDTEGIEVDFGDATFDASAIAPVLSGGMAGVASMDEVDEEEETLSGAESKYRSSEKPINKDIIKPSTHGGISQALANVLNGKSHKVIVCTGDRGSGVTVTAYSIAKEFAKKVPVLYFDCDIEKHGLLNYIDYESFRAYDRSMVEGIKFCKDSSIFMNSIVQYDINLDLLTSDWSCDASDEDITRAHNVVAENTMNYGVVVVDCPIEKLHLISDLIFIGNTIICMESSKRGVMNMLCGLEGSPLELRYKRCIQSKGIILATKLNKRVKSAKCIQYADTIFEPSGCDWLRMEQRDFNGNLTTDLLASIVEG